MSMQRPDWQRRAIESYRASRWYQADAEAIRAERVALKKVLTELGIDGEPENSLLEKDGISFRALSEGKLGNAFVSVTAYEECRFCREVRSIEFMLDLSTEQYLPSSTRVAVEFGRWLARPHPCGDRSSNPLRGFREDERREA